MSIHDYFITSRISYYFYNLGAQIFFCHPVFSDATIKLF